MRPRPIHRRADLLALVRDYVPSRACGRAMDEDRAIVHGGFEPPVGLPYWLVKVTSRHGRVWYIAVVCDEPRNRFSITYPDRVEWQHWAGSINGKGIKDGDDPRLYALMRATARRKHGTPKEAEAE